jgi:hypothetical protein
MSVSSEAVRGRRYISSKLSKIKERKSSKRIQNQIIRRAVTVVVA